jgi:hypothetical protein
LTRHRQNINVKNARTVTCGDFDLLETAYDVSGGTLILLTFYLVSSYLCALDVSCNGLFAVGGNSIYACQPKTTL